MTLSSNVLFHFTDSIQNLIDILTNNFRAHYSLEDFSLVFPSNQEPTWAFPLIPFCDIPLSQASKHMTTYGNYAVGLNKEWGIRNGVAPLLYCYPNSTAAVSIAELIGLIFDDQGEIRDRPGAAKITQLAHFLKQYEGPFLRRGRLIPNVRFYDEREWRFIPDNFLELPTMAKTEYLNFNDLQEGNEKARAATLLQFEPSDIKYIVVATETEILPMIQAVERIKQKYTPDQVKVLASRIISAEQIVADF